MGWIDVHYTNSGKSQRISSTKHNLTKFADTCGMALVILEASGGYERPLCEALALADMGRALELTPTPPPDPNRVRLADLVARRDDLVVSVRQEKNRELQACDARLRTEIRRIIRALETSKLRIEGEISALINADPELCAQSRRLCSVPGIGPTISAAILVVIPELGQLTRRQSASLAGLAPHACESGLNCGKRRIWKRRENR